MARRNYAAILLFVCGIIGVYSHSQKNDLTDYSDNEDGKHYESHLQLTSLRRNDERTRREAPLDPAKKLELIQKSIRIFQLRTAALRTPQVVTLSPAQEAHRERVRQFIEMVDNLVAAGTPRVRATRRIMADYPDLANRIVQYRGQ